MDIEEYIGHRVNNEPVSAELLAKPLPRAKRERKPRPGGHNNRNQGNRGRSQHRR